MTVIRTISGREDYVHAGELAIVSLAFTLGVWNARRAAAGGSGLEEAKLMGALGARRLRVVIEGLAYGA